MLFRSYFYLFPSHDTLTHDITNTTNATLPDTSILRWVNIAYGHRIIDILNLDDSYNANDKQVKVDFTAGTTEGSLGYNGEYPFPSDQIRPTRVEVSYDGVTFVPCDFYDLLDNQQSESHVDPTQFSSSDPKVTFDRGSFFIRPIPSSTIPKGIRIWYEKRQTDLTDGSPSFETNLHDILAYDAARIAALKDTKRYDAQWWRNFNDSFTLAQNRFIQYYTPEWKQRKRLTPELNDEYEL